MSFLQSLRCNFSIALERLGQLIEVDFIIGHLISRRESLTPHKWQTPIERQVAPLTICLTTGARTRAFTFSTATGRLALTSRNAASDAFSILFGALVGHKIV